MRVCALLKYPPIQGGVSAQGYWLARGLAERGHEVDVVTNAAEVEDEFRLRLTAEDRAWLTTEHSSGGRVRLHAPEPLSLRWAHVPQANPFVSKLAGIASRVVREHGSDLLFSYYLEPNGVAAALASSWTGVPYVVQHAGSDLGRLMQRPGLDAAYLEVFRRAEGICTGTPYTFLGMGVDGEHLYGHPPFHLPRDLFSPEAEPLDLDAHIAAMRAAEPDVVHSPGPLVPTAPTVGVYGKLGEAKGSYDLLAALDRLRREARRFNLVIVGGGRDLGRFRRALRDYGLEEVSWLLPFLPHWRIPGFLRACDAVCFLERDFPVSLHGPTVPREVLACGTCLVLSGEILAKQRYRELMEDGRNFLLVEDPTDHAALAAVMRKVVDEPGVARDIGRRGAEIRRETPDYDRQAEAYERIFEDVLDRAAGRPSRLTAAERGLADSRRSSLRRLVAPLLTALDGGGDRALDLHVEAHPTVDDPIADARALCEHWAGDGNGGNPVVREAAVFARRLIWLGSFEDDEAEPRFEAADVLPERSGGQAVADVVRDLAPLATRWLRVECFEHWRPPGTDAADGSVTVVFHKLPSLTGHHFVVDRVGADLLAACDGRASVQALVERIAQREEAPLEAVARAVGRTLRRFYREGLTIYVEPAAG